MRLGSGLPISKGRPNISDTMVITHIAFCDYYGTVRITWLSGFAMLPCFIALILLTIKIYKWYFKELLIPLAPF